MGLASKVSNAWRQLLGRLPVARDVLRTQGTTASITFKGLLMQKILGFNRGAYWPMHFTSAVEWPNRVRLGVGTAPGDSPGCYIQAVNGVEVGDYALLAPNVSVISGERDPYDLERCLPARPIRIGRFCWIGMNAVILPGVELGDHAVVAAGATVDESFPEGHCILGGVPAKVIKTLDPAQVAGRADRFEYVGFHPLAGRSRARLYEKLGVEGRANSAVPYASPGNAASDRIHL